MNWNAPWMSGRRFHAVPVGRSTVYHASSSEFTQFDPSKSKSYGYGPGFYFAENRADVKFYGPFLYTVEIDIRNPLHITFSDPRPQAVLALAKAAQMSEEDIEIFTGDGSHLMVSVMATLGDMGVKLSAISKFLQKMGYDSIIVDPSVINHESPGSVTGNFVSIFDPKSILSVSRGLNR